MLQHGWRWGYGMWAIVAPVAAIPLVAILFYHQNRNPRVDQHHDRRCPGFSPGNLALKTLPKRVAKVLWYELDIAGVILLIAGLTLTLVPLSSTGSLNLNRWGDPATIAMITLGPLCIAAFIAWEAFIPRNIHPCITVGVLKDPSVLASFGLGAVYWIGLLVFAVFMPSVLQVAGGFTPAQATRINNANRATFHVASIFVGLVLRWTKRPLWSTWVGVLLSVLAQGLLIYMVTANGRIASEAAITTAQVINGLGRGLFSTASQVLCQAVVQQQDIAVVTGVFFAMMSIGAAIGTSISGALWNHVLPSRLAAYLPAEAQGDANQIFASFTYAMHYPPGGAIREAINKAYRETAQIQAIAATAIMGIMILLTIFIRNVRLDVADAERSKQLDDELGIEARKVNDVESSNVPRTSEKQPDVEASTIAQDFCKSGPLK